jgi:TonB family protein
MKAVLILFMLWSLCFSTICGTPEEESAKVRFPEITFEIQVATGSYSKEEIKAVVDSGLLSLRTIHYKHLNKGLDFDGDVLLKFTIAKSGEITKIDIVRSSTGNAEFDKAIKNKIAAWKWNIKNNNTTVTILFKFATFLRTHYLGCSVSNRSLIISGVRPHKDILSKVRLKVPELTNIRNNYLKQNSDLDNEVIVIFKFEIAGSGEVNNVDILVNTAEYAEFGEAIKSKVANWKWEPIENGNTMVSVFWVFSKP